MQQHGMDDIWFKSHGKRHDLVYANKGNYKCLDLWNLFDGICWWGDSPVFFQTKTNSWANSNTLIAFIKNKLFGIKILSINVQGTEKKGWAVKARLYERSSEGVVQRVVN